MDYEERNSRNNVYGQFKSSMDIGMGVLYIIISGYAMNMKFIIDRYGKTLVWGIAILFILYGISRIVRGILFYKNRS